MPPSDKRATAAEVVAELRDGMTIGFGGWGSRRKPMAIVREILRTGLRDLTVAAYGGPDVGLLCAAGKVRKVVFGFVSLDSIPLEPHFRNARESGAIQARELDEGMFYLALLAAAHRMPFMPTRAGIGSDILRVNPDLQTVRSPYDDVEVVAVPPLRLDAAFVHVHRADAGGNGQILGPDPYFDDLFLMAAERRFVTAERIVPTERLTKGGPVQTLRVNRAMTDAVIETPNGAHFTSCVPDYPRDEAFQTRYADSAKDDDAWSEFRASFVDVTEQEYQRAVAP